MRLAVKLNAWRQCGTPERSRVPDAGRGLERSPGWMSDDCHRNPERNVTGPRTGRGPFPLAAFRRVLSHAPVVMTKTAP